MEWRPKRWIATLLSLFVSPLGMLYLQRPRLALIYLLASLLFPIAAIGLFSFSSVSVELATGLANWGVNIVAAIHAFRIASSPEPIATRRWYSRWYGLIGPWVAFAAVVFLFRSFCYEPFRIPSDSMYPTLPEGSFVFVKKWGYGDYGSLGIRLFHAAPTAEVARGELLLFRLPVAPETVYLKRVIGLPGDRIQCSEEQIVVNGTPVSATPLDSRGSHRFARETIDGVSFIVAHLDFHPAQNCELTVPEGHYFMLGDNRENSKDSRHFGPIPRGNLVGRVALTFPAADPDLEVE
jgi:signal peptidase I